MIVSSRSVNEASFDANDFADLMILAFIFNILVVAFTLDSKS